MIVEQRRYSLNVGQLNTYLSLYEDEGFAIQKPILGCLVGYFSTDIGTLHPVVHLWAYQNLEDRTQRRARLAADPAWQRYLKKVQPLQIAQQNEILMPAPMCPKYLDV